MAKEENKKNKGLDLPQTKGSFQIKGVVTGTQKDNFYKETQTKSQKPWRIVNFGVKTDKDSTVYITLSDGEKDKVYFSKTETVDGKKKTDVQDVAWKDRFKFNKEGYRLIGVNVGVSKTTDAKGNEVNDKKMLTGYDACKEINDNLVDNQSVFIRGSIDYSHFESNNATKRAIKFVPNQISLCKEVNFDEDDFVPTADFTQIIVFTDIKPEDESKKRFVVSAKIVKFDSIEDAEFIIENKGLASNFKKNLKPYTAIKVWGNIAVIKDTEEVEVSDGWGEENKMDKINSPTKRELIIIGADPKTIDKETYAEEVIENALAKIKASKKAENEFGVSDEWGSVSSDSSSDEDDEAW
jgi:hypothetical protein